MASSPRRVLVRHGRPDIRQNQPSATWELRQDARSDVLRLAEALTSARVITTSDEPKAAQTAELIRDVTEGDLHLDPRLREVTRPGKWLSGYEALAARYLSGEQQPGWEPIDAVLARTTEVISELPTGTIVVGHGLSLTLYTASCAPFDHVTFWRSLRFPDAWTATDGQAPRRIELPSSR